MSFVSVAPEMLTQTAGELASIGSTLSTANAAAAISTTAVAAPGADEVSAAIVAVLGTHAQQYQALGRQAETFHGQFVDVLQAGAGSYASTEAANAQQALANALLGNPLTAPGGAAAASPTVLANPAPATADYAVVLLLLVHTLSVILRAIQSLFDSVS